MRETLKNSLWTYIVENNPDLMFNLQDRYNVQQYLNEKVDNLSTLWQQLIAGGMAHYEVLEQCMNELTSDLRPSKYLYLRKVLEEDFSDEFERLREQGILTYELCNLIVACEGLFEAFGFSEHGEDVKGLRYAITGQVSFYLDSTLDSR